MAITFTSNQKATQYIKDRTGYKGAQDFKANLDFNTKSYVNNLWSNIDVSTAINTTRNSQASIMLSDDYSDYDVVENNILRISYIPDYKCSGLIVTGGITHNSLLDAFATTISIADDLGNGRIYYAMYAEQGTLSLTPTSGNAPTILQGDGSINNPLFFTLNGALTATINRSIAGSKVFCSRTPKAQCPFIPNFINAGINSDALLVNQTGVKGSLIMRYAEPKRKVTTINATDQFYPLLMLKQDAQNYFAMYTDKDGVLVVRMFVAGVEKFLIHSIFNIDRFAINTLKASWENGKIIIVINDKYFEFNERQMDVNFNVTSTKVLGSLDDWFTGQGHAAIFNLITYSRALSKQELLAANY